MKLPSGRRKPRLLMLFAVAAALVALMAGSPVMAQERVSKISDIQWKPGTLVYYKGDPHMDEAALKRLNEDLLKARVPVTVVFSANTTDERWTLPDGQKLTGHEAADFAVGHGLFNQGAFSAQVDKETGLPSGSAILVTFDKNPATEKRLFNFYSSELLNKHGLNWEKAWSNDIEDVAIPYLKQGKFSEGILVAVHTYNERLEDVLAAEARAKAEAVAAKLKAEADARAAEARAKALAAVMPWLILALLTLALLIWLMVLNRRASKAQADAKKELDGKLAALAGKGKLLADLNAKKASVLGANRSSVTVSGASQTLANDVIGKIGRARILIVLASSTVERAQKLVREGQFAGFSTRPYEEALQILHQRLEFDPKSGIKGALTGTEPAEQEYLWAPLTSFERVSTTFPALIDTFNAATKSASEGLDEFKRAQGNVARLITAAQQKLSDVGTRLDAVKALMVDEEQPLLAPIVSTTVPALTDEARRLGASALSDPVGKSADITAFSDRVERAWQCAVLLKTLLEKRAEDRARVTALEGTGIKLDWWRGLGASCVRGLITIIDSLDSATPDLTTDASGHVANFHELVGKVEELNSLRLSLSGDRERLAALLASKRIELSSALKVPAANLFAESSEGEDRRTPDQALADLERQIDQLRVALNAGNIDEAMSVGNRAKGSFQDADNDIKAALKVVEEYAPRVKAINAASDELGAEVAERFSGLLAELSKFDPDAMLFRAGDPSHPRADGTVANNLDEVEQAKSARAAALKAAEAAFESGALLSASDRLTDAENCNTFIRHRLLEIGEKHDAVTKAHKANEAAIAALLSGFRGELNGTFDASVRQQTIDSITHAVQGLEAAEKAQNAVRPNPFSIAELVAEAQKVSDGLAAAKDNDRSEFGHASDAISRVGSQLSSLSSLVSEMSGTSDQIPDAAALQNASRQLPGFQRELKALQAGLGTPHSDWVEIDERAHRLSDSVSAALLKVKQEHEEGQGALQAITRATGLIRDARNWSGSYGVSIDGSPGGAELTRARQCFDAGSFHDAHQLAESAANKAKSAIDEAEEEVERKRRAERERQERERREREERERASYTSYSSSSSSSGSFGGFGGGGSGGGGGGFGGGFSSGGGGGGFGGGFSSGGGGKGW